MNEVEACEHLDAKFEEFCKLIPPEIDYAGIPRKCYFAGGCIRSLLRGETPNDYDIFLGMRLTSVVEWWVGQGADKVSRYAITLGEFQLVTAFMGTPPITNVLEFDFIHNMAWYVPHSGHIETFDRRDCVAMANDNRLIFNRQRPRDVERVYTRIPKFLERGMTISEEERAAVLAACTYPEALDIDNYCFRERDENGNYGAGD